MKKLLIIIVFAICIVTLALETRATHISGSEIEWTRIGQDSLQLKLTTYRDCNGIAFNATQLTIYSAKDTFNVNTTIDTSETKNITPLCKGIKTRCETPGASFKFGITKYVVSAIINIDSLKKLGWCEAKIAWSSCCRSNQITTGLANKEFYIDADINFCNLVDLKWNHNPQLIFYLGQSSTEYFDINVSDNIDSIKYHFVPARKAKDSILLYNGSYTYNKPFNYLGFPRDSMALPRGIHLDSNYGQLKFRPMRIENAVVVVKASVYKSGKLIASAMRDIVIIVLKGNSYNNPVLSDFEQNLPSKYVDDFSIRYKKLVCGNKPFCFDIESFDLDNADSTTIEIINLPKNSNFTIKDSSAKFQEGSFCWDPKSLKTNSKATLALGVKDNNCPVYAKNTFYYEMTVFDSFKVRPKHSIKPLNNCGSYSFKVVEKDSLPFQWVKWFINDTVLISEKDSFHYSFQKTGVYTIKLIVNDCRELVFWDTVNVKNTNELSIGLNDLKICPSNDYELRPAILGNKGNFLLEWTFGTSLEYVTTLKRDTLEFKNSLITKYVEDSVWLKVSDSVGCTVDTGINVIIKHLVKTDIQPDDSVCSQIKSKWLNIYIYGGVWSGAGIFDNKIINTDSMILGNNLYTFSYQSRELCILDTAIIKLKKSPRVYAGGDFISCTSGDTIHLKGEPKGGIWTGQGVTSAGIFNPVNLSVGQTNLYYSFDSAGCRSSDKIKAKIFDSKPDVSVTEEIIRCINGDSATFIASKPGGYWTIEGSRFYTNPLVLYPNDYEVGKINPRYTYTDANKCRTTKESSFIINNIFAPSFTLNKDSLRINDTLIATNTSDFNRWIDITWEFGTPVLESSTDDVFIKVMDTTGIFDINLVSKHNKTECTDTLTKQLSVGFPVGLNPSFNEVRIFPNPVKNVLRINSKAKQFNVRLTTIQGQTLITSNEFQIDVNALPNGMYIAIIEINDEIFTRRFIKN
ncbi:MAG: T9SS type A sorting domain-containing protein [Bacteroidia bacterium]